MRVELALDVTRGRGVTVRYASMRRELFALHLPNPDRVQADYAVLSELSKGLSGGDLLNICVNAIYEGSVDLDSAKWSVTQGNVLRMQLLFLSLLPEGATLPRRSRFGRPCLPVGYHEYRRAAFLRYRSKLASARAS